MVEPAPLHSLFAPRPEAHATAWVGLLPPVRHAVHGLLARIAGAETARRKALRGGEFGHCFLVYGERGTGKTTVLLSAREAVRRPDAGAGFFPATFPEPAALGRRAQASAQELQHDRHVVWLDVLDLEPLPPSTNLLTTLLTRVRGALDDLGGEGGAQERAGSIFEESSGDVWQQFGELIHDATLMWEEIDEPDTRNRAMRQRSAADLYARFRGRFGAAMDGLSSKLGLRHGHVHDHDGGCAVVLPIDNVDRSPEHLKAIVKLAQMVAHPCLWLVMAGDRAEVTAFLERAYWKDLILGRTGADARGKAEQSGEDESLGMARRQAHAVAQKVWPASHRVQVDLVAPADTLAFRPSGEADSVRTLLAAVTVRCFVEGEAGQHHEFPFGELFELPADACPETRPDERLTRAARHGLRLPARAVLDLWQLARWVAADEHAGGAVTIARLMLRAATAASALPNSVTRFLQQTLVRRDARGGTLLNFDRAEFEVHPLLSIAASVADRTLSEVAEGLAIRSQRSLGASRDMLLHLGLNGEQLPELTAAWFTILFDVLFYVPDLALLGSPRIEVPLVRVAHQAVATLHGARREGTLELTWPTPQYTSFDAHEDFWRHWEGLRERPPAHCGAAGCPGPGCTALQLRSWLRAALRSFEDSGPPRRRSPAGATLREETPEVLDDAARCYERITMDETRPLAARRHFESTNLCRWLESQLPLLLTRLLAPLDPALPSACRTGLLQWVVSHRDTPLVAHWRRQREFLWADLDARLDRLSGPGEPLAAEQRQALQDWAYGELRKALG